MLFFIHVGTRRVHLAGMSARPNAACVAERARGAAPVLVGQNVPGSIVLHDWDSRFTQELDGILQAGGIRAKNVGPCKANQNAFAERWGQSIKQESLERFMVFGEEHLEYIVTQYVEHFNEERQHQARDNLPLNWTIPNDTSDSVPATQILCDQRLGGLLKNYRRAA